MAASGQEKWDKYFKTASVETTIDTKKDLNAPVYVEPNGKGNTKNGHLLKTGDKIRVVQTKSYNSRYLIEYTHGGKSTTGYVQEKYVAKPNAGGMTNTESLAVRAETLITGGTKITYEFLGEKISAYEFKTAQSLANSILKGMRDNTKINRDDSGIVECFEQYFDQTNPSKIPWNQEVTQNEINQLGKYVGELLVGYLALKQNNSAFQTPLYQGVPARFIVPDDPAFTGVDSFLELSDKSIIPISSKFGGGAKASFFANLFYKVQDLPTTRIPQGCFLTKMIASAKKANVTSMMLQQKRGTMDLVYMIGTRDILGITDIIRPIVAKDQIKNGTFGKESDAIIEAIGLYSTPDSVVLQNLPLSVTSFFCREIAKKLNADTKSIKVLKEILIGKNFVQANLNITKWKAGEIEFKFLKSGDATLDIIGTKAGSSDINAKQGTVNYELKY